jgi:ABC-type transport system involved in multi-copper enzyme maturation permease subunit
VSVFVGLIYRELLRSFRSGLWYAAAATFYFAYAIYFDLIFTSAAGPQPQPISPMRSLFSAEMLMLWILFIPVLAQKSIVEERQHKTWDVLVTTGMDLWSLLLAKFLANTVQLAFWLLTCLSFPIAFAFFIDLDLASVLASLAMVFLVAQHWLALCYALLCKTKSFVPAYFKAGIVLLLYYLFPLLVVMLPDPFYRPIFETLDLRGVLDRASQGIVLGHDLIWLLGGIAVFLMCAHLRLSNEVSIGIKKWRDSFFNTLYLFGCCFVLIFALFVSHSRSWVWDVSPQRQGEISDEYRQMASSFPSGLEVTAALPKRWNAPSYAQARTCLLTFLEKTKALAPGLSLNVLDPDIDILAMERLREAGGMSDNKIGFVSIAYNGRRLNIPYPEWVSIGTLTIDNEPHRYLRAFKGEDQMVRVVNNLSKSQQSGKILVFSGHGEVELGNDDPLGGSEFLDLVRQFGLEPIRFKPDLDVLPEIASIKLILILDPQTGMSEAFQKILIQAFEHQVPILAATGPSLKVHDPDSKSILKHYGILNSEGVIYQKHYHQYDPYTLPMAELSTHPLTENLQKRVLLFDHVSALREGIPQDPRLKVVPLIRTQKSNAIWDEHQYDPQQPMVRHNFGAKDKASPLYSGMAAQWHTDKGIVPAVVVLGSRSLFENRWIHQGANRELLFQSIDWLLNRQQQVHLPASVLANYRVEASPTQQIVVQGAVTFIPPLLFIVMGLFQWRRRQ